MKNYSDRILLFVRRNRAYVAKNFVQSVIELNIHTKWSKFAFVTCKMYNANVQLDELADLTDPSTWIFIFLWKLVAIDEFLINPSFKKNLISRYISLRILYIYISGIRGENILEVEKFSLFPWFIPERSATCESPFSPSASAVP